MANPLGNPGLKMTVTIGGKKKTFKNIMAAAKAFKIPYGVLYQRLFIMEWDAKKSLTTPVRKRKKSKATKRKKRL